MEEKDQKITPKKVDLDELDKLAEKAKQFDDIQKKWEFQQAILKPQGD